jgi:halocyanin-like protein
MSDRIDSAPRSISRRGFLAAAGGVAAAGATAGAAAVPAAAQDGGPDYGGWFDGVSNFDGTVDRTGREEVTVAVGSEANGGSYGFDPPAVRVDPGTTVVWEWTGEGSVHNVVDEAGGFESDLTDEAGHTFEHTFESSALYKYACVPHRSLGMKGAVVVGSGGASGSAAGEAANQDAAGLGDELAIGGGLGLAGVLFGLFVYGVREDRQDAGRTTRR